MRNARLLSLCVVSAAVGAVLATGLLLAEPQRQSIGAESAQDRRVRTVIDPMTELTPEEQVNVSVYARANRSVVNVITERVQVDRFFMREFSFKGEGSGTVIDSAGHILTNEHVVEGEPREIQVTLFNGKTYRARKIGADPATDMAVLKIDAPEEELFPVSFGDSTSLKVGQKAYAIGNPFGLERTLSIGHVSSLNRTLPRRTRRGTIKSIIQIDAAINPGNSGGPLLDSHARMIGMNTAIATKTGESAGVGFAIPVSTIARIVPQLIRDGRILRAEIGISVVAETERGLLIAALAPDGPADKAGLKGFTIVRRRYGPVIQQLIDRSTADLITAVDGKAVRTSAELLNIVEAKKPGEEVIVSIVRQGKRHRIVVRLESE